MRIIDCRLGTDVKVGVPVVYAGDPEGSYVILAVDDRFFSATARVRIGGVVYDNQPLLVRFLHPSFLFQRVLFVPS